MQEDKKFMGPVRTKRGKKDMQDMQDMQGMQDN